DQFLENHYLGHSPRKSMNQKSARMSKRCPTAAVRVHVRATIWTRKFAIFACARTKVSLPLVARPLLHFGVHHTSTHFVGVIRAQRAQASATGYRFPLR